MVANTIIKYTVGCGKRNWPGWEHVDGGEYDHVKEHDIHLSFAQRNSVDLIYSSHLIAYFDYTEAEKLLKNWFYVLQPGGTLRIATPDFNILSKMYQVGVELDKLKGPLYGQMGMNGEAIYHKTVYDEQALTALLTDAGFVNIHRYDHTKTEHPNTGNREDFYDDHSAAYLNNTLISLNLECQKP